MRVIGLALAMAFVVSGACFAETCSFDLYADSAMISLPQVPINPDPASVFSTSGIDPMYNISRWDPIGGGYVGLDDSGAYGMMLLGDGFWISGTAGTTISYEALKDGVPDAANVKTDMWISLPGQGLGTGGLHLIGNPFNHQVDVDKGSFTGDNILFTDGTQVLTWGEAANLTEPWVGQTMSYWTGFGYDDVWFDNTVGPYQLDIGKAYWIATYKDNLAMIIPAQ